MTGKSPEYEWGDAEKISDIPSEDTEETLTYNLPNIPDDETAKVEIRKFNWTPLYGELGPRRIFIQFI